VVRVHGALLPALLERGLFDHGPVARRVLGCL
jgi:hypothetical protein